MDFGFTNDPTALIAVYRYGEKLIADEIIYRTRLTNSDIVREFERLGVEKHHEIFADSSEPKSIEDIFRAGYNIKPVLKGADSIRYGISIMQEHEILLTKRSGNTRKESRKYCWAKDKN